MRPTCLPMLFVFSMILVLQFTGCGGGSQTDIFSNSLRGTIVSPDGIPVSGVQVTIVETGDTGITDQAGQFLITTGTFREDVTLNVMSGGVSGSVGLKGIPGMASVFVELSVFLDGSVLTVEVLDFAIAVPEGSPRKRVAP